MEIKFTKTTTPKEKQTKHLGFGKILKFKMRDDAAKRLGIKKVSGIVTKE